MSLGCADYMRDALRSRGTHPFGHWRVESMRAPAVPIRLGEALKTVRYAPAFPDP
jgi:hypothetical protein